MKTAQEQRTQHEDDWTAEQNRIIKSQVVGFVAKPGNYHWTDYLFLHEGKYFLWHDIDRQDPPPPQPISDENVAKMKAHPWWESEPPSATTKNEEIEL